MIPNVSTIISQSKKFYCHFPARNGWNSRIIQPHHALATVPFSYYLCVFSSPKKLSSKSVTWPIEVSNKISSTLSTRSSLSFPATKPGRSTAQSSLMSVRVENSWNHTGLFIPRVKLCNAILVLKLVAYFVVIYEISKKNCLLFHQILLITRK